MLQKPRSVLSSGMWGQTRPSRHRPGPQSAKTERVPAGIREAGMDVRFVSPAGVELFDAKELPALLARTDGLVWVDIPVWDEQAEQTLSDDVRVPSARDPGLGESQSGAQDPSLRRSCVPGAARAAARRRRARALCRTRPVHRRPLPGHGARPAQSRGRPDGGDGRGGRGARPAQKRKAQARQGIRALVCPADRIDRPAAHLHRGADQGRLEARAAGHRRPPWRPRDRSSTRCSGPGTVC